MSSGVCPECGATGDFHGLCPECRYGSEFLRPPRPLRARTASPAPVSVAEVQLKRRSTAPVSEVQSKAKTAAAPTAKGRRKPVVAKTAKRPTERTAPNEVVAAASKALAAVSAGSLSRRQQKSALELAIRWLGVAQEVKQWPMNMSGRA